MDTEIFFWPVQFCLFAIAATFLLSLITKNVSQVDRLWTFLPTIYTAYFALIPLWSPDPPFFPIPYIPTYVQRYVTRDFSPRALLMLALVVVWMARLSYNTYRRGLFNLKDEDYRWAVLRKQLPPWLFQVVNFTFIATTQNVLLLLLGMPTYVASVLQPHKPLAPSDMILAAFALVTLALEFTADNQQFAFQTYKRTCLAKFDVGKAQEGVEEYDAKMHWPGARLAWTPEDARRGFVTRGLWAYVRHPNFVCEQAFWWIITLMPLLSPYHPSLPPSSSVRAILTDPAAVFRPLALVLPAFALSLLFFSSTLYTEAISMSKYPEAYAAYRERVGMFGIVRTWEKGVWLGWKGRRAQVEEKIWGRGVVENGKED